MNIKQIALLTASAGLLFGCSSVPVQVQSNPPGATVYLNNRSFGETPVEIGLRKDTYTLRVEKENYLPHIGTIGKTSKSPFKVNLEKDYSNKSAFSIINVTDDSDDKRVRVHAELEVIERSPNVKTVRKVTSLSENSWLNSFTLSPNGETILLSQLQEESTGDGKKSYSNIWSINAKKPGPMRRVTQGKTRDVTPSFSTDGKYVFFSSNRMASFDIWKLNYEKGSGLALQTSSSSMDETSPQLSPKTETMLFAALMPGSDIEQIWLQELSSGQLYQLREGTNPHWSPDGSKILFSAQERSSGEWKIWTMNADGSSPTQISVGSGNDRMASFSPDGKSIVFASDRAMVSGKNNYDIWIMTAEGSDPIQLTTNGSVDDMPVFSTDGKIVFFRSNRGLNWNIWAIEIK